MSARERQLRNIIVEQAAEWHVAQAEGPLSPQQAREFMCWLRASPQHVAEYLLIAELDNDLVDAARASDASLAELLEETTDVVPLLPVRPHGPGGAASLRRPRSGRRANASSRNRNHYARGARWIAAIGALVAITAVALTGWYWLRPVPATQVFRTGRGVERSVYLPDHTLLRLDAESRVAVHFSRSMREVAVERGQAYFDVTDDPHRPFSVKVGSVLIRDIGTVFDVSRGSTQTTITVVEGHVRVWKLDDRTMGPRAHRRLRWGPLKSREPVATLDAGEQLVVARTGHVTSSGKAALWRTLAWTQGRIAFDDKPLADVVALFNRHNRTQIKLNDPSIGALRITGSFGTHDIGAFTRFVEGLPGVAVRARDGRVTIHALRNARRD